MGDLQPYHLREFIHQNYLFNLEIAPFKEQAYLLKIKGWEQISLSIEIGKEQKIYEAIFIQDLIFGIYFGVIIALVLYNLFIFISVRDSSYLYYILFVLFVALTQATINGYSFRFLWPNMPEFGNSSLIIFPAIAGIATCKFIERFLNTKKHTPYLGKGLIVIVIAYIISSTSNLLGFNSLSFKLTDLNAVILSLYALIIAITVSLKGYRPAKFFLLAWTTFLTGVILFVLKNSGVLPSNNFTLYTMPIGSALETTLLSFALADRINIYKKERLDALEVNERLIKEQNIILEQKVKERTAELNKAIEDLKQAQSQLVESEKMASLGQLTAGIAHEINNPINFVSSNVFPLKQDIDDLKSILNKYAEITESADLKSKLNEINQLKEELDYEVLLEELDTIIHGIEDGAKRTAEIVSGLRNFSRLDESEFQSANVNDCINTTLKIINPKLDNIEIVIELDNIPPIDCYPGKLNQFFLNTIDNAIYAVNAVKTPNHKGEITVKTALENKHIVITIKDNGIGMDETTKNKIFEPFFTTKDVGEGTGLGMSIAHGILEMHQAKIEIESEINKGTEIKIFLPLTLPTWKE
jgi:signal transduction histidine kinase